MAKQEQSEDSLHDPQRVPVALIKLCALAFQIPPLGTVIMVVAVPNCGDRDGVQKSRGCIRKVSCFKKNQRQGCIPPDLTWFKISCCPLASSVMQ